MIPLSFTQQRLWFIDQLEGGASPTYNIPLMFRLSGPLDKVALRLALSDVAGRHEALRTLFREDDGIPYQVIVAQSESHVPFDFAMIDEDELQIAADSYCHHAFDLANELPFRTKLLGLGPEDHVLILLMHHIVGDEWSIPPLTLDLATAYTARLGGAAPSWDPLPVQYGDYTLWQRELLGSEDDPDSIVSRQLDYWRETLAGLPEELKLPMDRPRPATPSHRGACVNFDVRPDLHRALLDLGRESRTTLFMVLQAAVAAWLSRLGAGTDIPLGVPVAGRSDDALNNLVGLFVNTIVTRIDVSGDPSFNELLHRVRGTNLGAYSNQDVPFDRLVEVLNPARSLARNPLFQVSVALQTHDSGGLDLPGLTATPVRIDWDQAKFDLAIYFSERAPGHDGLDGVIEYATDLFDGRTVELLTAQLGEILEAVAADPGKTVSQLSRRPAGNVLLTGATGYFGAFLLSELVNQTGAHITCLVRADSVDQGRARIRENLERFDRWSGSMASRVSAIPADLALPELGLSRKEFDRLAEEIDVIYHNGAHVNIVLPFAAIRDVNVTSTRELVRMAWKSKQKPFHYISTVSPLSAQPGEENGYVLSKRLSERLLIDARDHGLPASIYRIPRLSLDSRTARGNPRDISLRLLRTVLDLGVAPDLEFSEWWVPVDEAARLVVAESLSRPDGGQFSVAASEVTSWRGIVNLIQDAGYEVTVKPIPEWARDVMTVGSDENRIVLESLGLDEVTENDAGAGEDNERVFDEALAFGEILTVPQVREKTLLRYLSDTYSDLPEEDNSGSMVGNRR